MKIEPTKTYTTGDRAAAYKAKQFLGACLLRDANGTIIDDVKERTPLPNGSLFLCDMNRSQAWKDSKGLQGWGEGYLVSDGVAAPHAYDVADGVTSLEPVAGAVLSVWDFVGCDVASRKTEVAEWLGLEAHE